jgi:biopolymer transport protein ExbB
MRRRPALPTDGRFASTMHYLTQPLYALALVLGQTPPPPAPATTTGPAAGAGAAAPVVEQSTSLWKYIQDGGFLGYVMIGISVFALALTIRNFLILRKQVQVPGELGVQLEGLVKDQQYAQAIKACENGPFAESFLARTVGTALERAGRSPFGTMELRSAIEDAGSAESERLHRNNDMVGIIAAVGPMLGLLGTVVGMIGAFRAIGTITGAARSTQLATFMSMALVNTAQGLIIAIPSTELYAIFRRKIDVIVDDGAKTFERLIAIAQASTPRTPGVAQPRPVAPTMAAPRA